MEQHNIIFPALTFTSPGVYSYTIRELTGSDERWETDNRVYRAVVTVSVKEDGTLTATVDYPDGFPRFINIYHKPFTDICKYFNKLPFPMFWFMPLQKPEFMELNKTNPDLLDRWEKLIKKIGNI